MTTVYYNARNGRSPSEEFPSYVVYMHGNEVGAERIQGVIRRLTPLGVQVAEEWFDAEESFHANYRKVESWGIAKVQDLVDEDDRSRGIPPMPRDVKVRGG